MGHCAFDTNIVVYLVRFDPIKTPIARAMIGQGGIVSVQLLNETANVLRRKAKFDWRDTLEFLVGLTAKCRVVPVTLEVHARGLRYAERHQLAIFDGMIVAAAVLAGCTTLYSEDMHHGLVIDGLTIQNPFAAA